MKIWLKKITALALLLVLAVTTFPTKTAEAASQFSFSYDISFNFGDNGQAQVTQKISLTNLSDKYYASEYSLKINSDKVSNVSGSDGLGSLNISTKTSSGSTSLIAKLNQQIVGVNKSVHFQISYLIDSLAVKRGRIWEVNIPQITTSENVASYKLTLSTPTSFGKLGKMSPTPDIVSEGGPINTYTFTKNNIGVSGIGATFGDFQLFKFKLIYRYKNPNLFTARATIALPPDTEYQAMYYSELDPKPLSMQYDDSGNYLASYNVKAGKTLEVIASGVVQIFNSDQALQRPKSWSDSELKQFTKSDRYIDSDNQLIQAKAKELKDIKAIYDFVTTTLKYDYSRLDKDSLGRRGSIQALTKPEQSICTDFADLFVALARAKGIPARGLVGFAFTDNTNLRPTKLEGLITTTILHAWPEYYDREKGRWIQVDPTWGSTTGGVDYFNKLDTNHFVFVINGTSSTSPIPAGGYKTASNQNDDVKVEFTNTLPTVNPDFSVSLDRSLIISGFPGKGNISIDNHTGRALFASKVVVGNQGVFGLINPATSDTGLVLPFENKTTQVKIRSDSLLDNKIENLNLKLTGRIGREGYSQETTQKVEVKPFFSFNWQQVVLMTMLVVVVISYCIPRFYQPKVHRN